jgi:hypothetical protein
MRCENTEKGAKKHVEDEAKRRQIEQEIATKETNKKPLLRSKQRRLRTRPQKNARKRRENGRRRQQILSHSFNPILYPSWMIFPNLPWKAQIKWIRMILQTR